MIELSEEELARRLAEISEWRGKAPAVWKRALSEASGRSRKWFVMLHSKVDRRVAGLLVVPGAIAAVALVALIAQAVWARSRVVGANPRGVGQSIRVYSNGSNSEWFPADIKKEFAGEALVRGATPDAAKLNALGYIANEESLQTGRSDARTRSQNGTGRLSPSEGRSTPRQFLTTSGRDSTDQARNLDSAERQVIRKATMELVSADVRAAFLRASQLISDAQGEYVQDSSIIGTGRDTQANLTLRVAAARISTVLNELRELGDLRSENQAGEDVTAQVVDLDAHVRNEKRVETELLELFDKRKDAPLKEVLELRDKLSEVRQSIEQLTAGREKLGRLVSLATVLVIIRTKDTPVEVPRRGVFDYFVDASVRACGEGLRTLSDSVAWLMNVLVGGLIWWALLIVAALTIRRRLRMRP